MVPILSVHCCLGCGRRGGLKVSALNSRVSSPGSSHGQGHCTVHLQYDQSKNGITWIKTLKN